jgi:hypothetical protein
MKMNFMNNRFRKAPSIKSAVFILLCFFAVNGFAQQPAVFSKNGFAVGGYDVVEYFVSARPVKGDSSIAVQWNNAKWIFSKKENAALFTANPQQYAPQYGGYCAFGMSRGYKAPTSEDAWSIVNNKLYFNYNKDVQKTWNKDQPGFIQKADSNWVSVQLK